MALKNLGTVAAIFFGTIEPDNNRILWYDENVDILKYYNQLSSSWDAFATSAGQIKLNALDPLGYLEDKLHASLEITSGELKVETSLLTRISGALLSANNLSDLANVTTARTNLSVYSIASIDGFIGNRSYTQENFVVNGQNLTASIDALDQALSSLDNIVDVVLTTPLQNDILVRSGSNTWINQRKYINATGAQYTPTFSAGQLRLNEAYTVHDLYVQGDEQIITDFRRSDGSVFPVGTVLYLTLVQNDTGGDWSQIRFGGTSNIIHPLADDFDETILINEAAASTANGMVLNIVRRNDGKWASFSNEKLITKTLIGDLRYNTPYNVADGDDVTLCITNLDEAIGNYNDYVYNHYITDGENLATSIGKLDVALYATDLATSPMYPLGNPLRAYVVTQFSPRQETVLTSLGAAHILKLNRTVFLTGFLQFTTPSSAWLNQNEILVKFPIASGFPTCTFVEGMGFSLNVQNSSTGAYINANGFVRLGGDYNAYQNEFIIQDNSGNFALNTMHICYFNLVLFTTNLI